MHRGLLSLVLLLLPFAAAAQQVTVRSGDHDAFTRLVFNLPARIEWSLQNSEGESRLSFDIQSLSFDTSEVFERIRRDRLVDLIVGEDSQSVTLRFACDCAATGFWFGQSMLVVDISDAADEASDDASKEAGSKKAGYPTRPGLSAKGMPELPVRNGSTSIALMRDAFELDQGLPHPDHALPPRAQPTRNHNLSDSQNQLLLQLGRATNQGLLAPKVKLPGSSRPKHDEHAEAADKSSNMALQETREPVRDTPNLHINVHTSIDRDFLETLPGDGVEILPDGCLEDSLLDVVSWGSADPFWQQVGPLRSRMTSEFDRTDDLVARRLAQTYIYFGFGLEAMQVVDLLAKEQESTQVLSALAQIMDTGSADGAVLRNQLDCASPIAMWSALSYETIPSSARLNSDALLQGFSALPPHLRTHLGPILSSRLRAAGYKDESATILRILNRIEETQTPASDLVAADFEMDKGDQEAAEDLLVSVVESNSVLSPDALILEIDSKIAREEDVSFDQAQLAAAYAFEYAGTPLGTKLSRSHILALGASGAFEDAFSELDRLERQSGKQHTPTRSELTTRLAARAAPIEVLRFVLSGQTADPADLTQKTALKVADHLFEAGFFERSLGILTRSFQGEPARLARLRRAEAALALRRPRQAEVELLGLTGRDSNALRARARSMVGQHKQAFELFKSAGLDTEAAREAWLADDWSTPKGIKSVEAQELAAGAAEEGALAQNRALLEDADATRSSLEALLSKAPGPALEN